MVSRSFERSISLILKLNRPSSVERLILRNYLEYLSSSRGVLAIETKAQQLYHKTLISDV